MKNKTVVNIADKVGDIIIREGDALPLKEPTIINIKGTIDAPSRFLTAKKGALSPIDSHLLVDINGAKITFIADEKNFYKSTVEGSLQRSKALNELGINDAAVFFTDKGLAKFIKQHIFYFADSGKANELVNQLMKFSAKIQTDIKSNADLRGNVSLAYDRVTSTGLPETIDITCKIFEGLPPETFTVNVCIEAEASALKFYFDSPALFMLEEKLKTEYLTKEASIFEGWGCAVVNI